MGLVSGRKVRPGQEARHWSMAREKVGAVQERKPLLGPCTRAQGDVHAVHSPWLPL